MSETFAIVFEDEQVIRTDDIRKVVTHVGGKGSAHLLFKLDRDARKLSFELSAKAIDDLNDGNGDAGGDKNMLEPAC